MNRLKTTFLLALATGRGLDSMERWAPARGAWR